MILFIFLVQGQISAQDSSKRSALYDMFISASPPPDDSGNNGKRIFVVPVFGHTPEGGYEYGAAAFKNFFLKNNRNFRPSYLTAKGSLTSKNAVNFIGYGEFWNNQNKDFISFDMRHQEYPFYYYGIGNDTKLSNKVQLNEKLSHINIEAAHAFLPHYYIGLYTLFEQQSFYTKDTFSFQHFQIPITERTGKYFNFGITQTFDNRDNVQYATNGLYAYVRGSLLPQVKRFNNFSAAQYFVNFKAFATPIAHLTFGYNLIYNQFQSKSSPFYLLPQLGNDEIMRGYYEGRFRGKKLLAHQIELRYRFIPRFAVTGFSSMGETTSHGWVINQFRYSYGGGVRYFFDVMQGSTVRFDYALTQKLKGEKRQTGIYIILGEAF